MLVFFLVFGQIFTLLVAKYLVSILHIFFGLFKGLLSLHSLSFKINKNQEFIFLFGSLKNF